MDSLELPYGPSCIGNPDCWCPKHRETAPGTYGPAGPPGVQGIPGNVTTLEYAEGWQKANNRVHDLEEAIRDIKAQYDWWTVDPYDRCQSVVDDAIRDAMKLVDAPETIRL